MSKVDSLDSKYKFLGLISLFKKVTSLLVIAETIGAIWLSAFIWFKIIVIVSVVLNTIFLIVFEVYNYRLEQLRIVNAIENGFQKSIDSNVETNEYYNNEVKKGLDKFVLNIFESVFFTKKIFEREAILRYILFLVFIVSFVVGLSIASLDVSLIICEVVFSCGIAYDFYRLILFHAEISRLYNQFDSIYVAKNQNKQKELLLALCFQYEKIKSYVSLSLSSRLFRRMNSSLTDEWNSYLTKILEGKK